MSCGYVLRGCSVLNQNGQVLDPEQLKSLSCVLCKFTLRDACQIACGDRICRSCIPILVFDCPSCGEKVDPTARQGYFVDKRCQKDIQNLTVVCKCGESLLLKDWEVHSDTCSEFVKAEIGPSAKEHSQLAQNMRRMEAAISSTRAEVCELMKTTSKSYKKMDTLEKDVKSLKDTVDQLQKLVLDKVNELSEIVNKNKLTIAQINETVTGINETIPRYETMLEEMNLKVEILEVKSCTGVYIWKVNELSRRLRDAKDGRTISLYSPPFYTSMHGYRLCLRAYLNGDGDAKGKYISLFVVVMKSEYDDLLTWPFSHSVTITLINQTSPQILEKSITHKFKPNPSSSSFQRPKETFNIASGFPFFALINTTLRDSNFCQNDTIYFRVKLDPPAEDLTGPDMFNYH